MDLKTFEIKEPIVSGVSSTSQNVNIGKLITPKQHLFLISAGDWEEFIAEWGHFQKKKYHLVTGLGGANDYGVDVACFHTNQGFRGDWDNFQCKYYKGEPLSPGTAIPEIGKFLWHIYNERISIPKNYYFFSPKDCGPSLKKLLLDSDKLKQKLFDEWDNWCKDSITTTQQVELNGPFLQFVTNFNFNIFQYKPVLEIIEEHRTTPYFSARFGGGLQDRPEPIKPPEDIDSLELKYIEQLKTAYADHKKVRIQELDLEQHPELKKHFNRQREAFYYAESLRSFARDSVPSGTFESLQNDMYDGVIDTLEAVHEDGFKRINEVMKDAKLVPLDANGLFQVVRVKDRYGICHQLANEDRISWSNEDESM